MIKSPSNTRARALAIAQDQLRDGGYDALNFVPIAAELGTTRTNIHHHFQSKERLALEATIDYIETSLQATRQLRLKLDPDFPAYAAQIEEHTLSALRGKHRGRACICLQLLKGDRVPDELVRVSSEFLATKLDIMTGIASSARDAGILKPCSDPAVIAARISALIYGMAQMGQWTSKPRKLADSLLGSTAAFLQPYVDKTNHG